jgi:hypothetical protein
MEINIQENIAMNNVMDRVDMIINPVLIIQAHGKTIKKTDKAYMIV